MPLPPSRQSLIDEATAEFRRRLEAELPNGTATLDEIESTVARIQREVSADLQRRLVQERTQQARDNRIPCPCGARARYRDDVARHLITRHGDLRLARPYYHCDACGTGCAPLDQELGLDAGSTTTQVRLWVADLAVDDPFAAAAGRLERLTGVRLAASTVEETAVGIGQSLRAAQVAQAEQHQQGRLPIPSDRRPTRLYAAIDGSMVPLREPWKRDGSAGKLTCRYGECKSAVLYEASPSDRGDRGVKRRQYVSTLGDVHAFRPLVATAAHLAGQHLAREVVVLGDGAPWIWNLAASQFPGAIQILDFYHASEHLNTVAQAMFRGNEAAASEWVDACQELLLADEVATVVAAITAWQPRGAQQRQLRQREREYFANNAERLRYDTFQQKGYHIGSGVVESACRHVVGHRLDEAGMHWRPESAEAILALRTAWLSTDRPDLRPHCAFHCPT